jgi:hypothetical protein
MKVGSPAFCFSTAAKLSLIRQLELQDVVGLELDRTTRLIDDNGVLPQLDSGDVVEDDRRLGARVNDDASMMRGSTSG